MMDEVLESKVSPEAEGKVSYEIEEVVWPAGFFARWLAFLFPVAGWKKRFISFKAGQKTWPVPGRPDCPKVIPFPVQWIPHRELKEGDPEAAQERGFVFLSAICSDSRDRCDVGVGVSCLRCGVPLHPLCAHMGNGFDPPYCKRCKWPIFLAKPV